MTTVAFYNVYDSIKATWTGGAESGLVSFYNKKQVSFQVVNTDHFYIKCGAIATLVRYAECSAVNPPGHANATQLVTILESWISASTDSSVMAEKDLMQRTKVVQPWTMFESTFRTSLETRKWNQIASGGTTAITYDSDEQMAILTPDATNAASYAVLQSKKYMMYQPGKSLNVIICCMLRDTLAVANNAVQIGYFDDATDKSGDTGGSGIILEMDATGALSLITRNFTGGVQTDSAPVASSSWNIDAFDGNGVSGITLDPTKINNYVFEVASDGGGMARFGIMYDNHIYFGHVFNENNVLVNAFLHTCTLPVRVQTKNSGVSAACFTTVYSASVTLDGGSPPHGFTNSADEGVSGTPPHILKSTGDSKPLLSIRLKAARCRTTLWPQAFEVVNTRDNSLIRLRLVLNATLTGPSWTSAGTDSAVEYDKTATAVAAGTNLLTLYKRSNDLPQINVRDIFDSVQLHANIAGSSLDTITLVGEYVNSQADLYTSCAWLEYY